MSLRLLSRVLHSSLRSLTVPCALALLWLLGACTTYEPKPLDLELTRQQWLDRSASDDSVRSFAERLAVLEPERGAFDPSDGLTLAEAEAVGVVFNRELRVMRRASSVARATAENAGIWEDPVLGVELERIVQDVPNPWIVGATVGITIPISGRLEAERARADRALEAELETIAAHEWQLRMSVRSAWVEWSSQRLRAELLEQLVAEVESVAALAARLEEAGVLARVDARLFSVELASGRAERVMVAARTRELELELLDLLGLAPSAPVQFVPQVTLPPSPLLATSNDEVRRAFESRSLELAAARRQYEVAEAALALEVRRQYPDLTIGPGYKSEDAQSRVLLGLSLPMPIWNRNQQGVAESMAQREEARESFDALYEHLVSRLEVASVRARAASEVRLQLERDLLPIVDRQNEEVRRSAELGRVDPLLLLETLRSRYDARLRTIDARAAESTAIAHIDELVGPPTDVSVKDAAP